MKLLPLTAVRSFIAIVDNGSMQKASKKQAVTQAALSLRLARLEELVQRPLFVRDGNRLSLTPAGETLLEFARKILDLNDRAIAALSAEISLPPARLGMVQDFADPLLNRVFVKFN